MRLSPLLLSTALLVSPAGRGTTLVPMSPQALQAASKVVAVAQVLQVESRAFGARIATLATVEVRRPVKGSLAGQQLTILIPGGSVGDWVQQVEGTPTLIPGEKRLFFLDSGPGGRWQLVGLQQGAAPVVADRTLPGGWGVELLGADETGGTTIRRASLETVLRSLGPGERLP